MSSAVALGGGSNHTLALQAVRPDSMTRDKATRVQTLGGLCVWHEGKELTSLARRPIQCALLTYLAIEREASRDTVMTILWPEKDQVRGRGSLNNTAYELRGLLGDEWVTLRGELLRISDAVTTDLGELEEAVEEERYTDAVGLCRGPFLPGSGLVRSSEFDHWIDRQQTRLEALERRAWSGLVRQQYDRAALAESLRSARSWVERAELDDQAHYWLIRLLAETGHRAEALSTYEHFASVLGDRLGVLPDGSVEELVAGIREGSVGPTGLAHPPARRPTPEAQGPGVSENAPLTPDSVWRPSPGWGKKLLKIVGWYVAVSAGVLQGVDVLISNFDFIPGSFFLAAFVIALCGVPIVVVTAFLQSRPVAEQRVRGLGFVAGRWFSWRNAALAGVAAVAAWTTGVVGWSIAGRLARDDSVAVIGFHTSSSDEEERRMADELADEVARELAKWDSVRVVPPVALAGPTFDLGIAEPTVERIEDGFQIARRVRASRLAAITLDLRGDSAFASATMFDVGRSRSIRAPIEARASAGEFLPLAERLSHGILGLDTLAIEAGGLRRGTTNPVALLADIEGQRHLDRWELEEAEEAFRAAIAVDNEFSVAHLHLAQSLYWRSARAEPLLKALGPEIAEASARAMDNRGALGFRYQTHITAFHAFQEGDYARARSLYHALLRRDTTDVYAHLMLGSVEYRDPWLETSQDGSRRPRSSLNVALASFAEAVRLQPSFELGYGHLLDLVDRVASTSRGCLVYEEPESGSLRPVWDPSAAEPSNLQSFCPVPLDSIHWVARADLDAIDEGRDRDGVDKLVEEALNEMRRWAGYVHDRPTPREQLSRVWRQKRQRIPSGAPEELRALADSALTYHALALGMRGDTVAADLALLSGLQLASGRVAEAAATAELSVAWHRERSGPGDASPLAAINAFLATSQPTLATELLALVNRRAFVQDPESLDLIPYGEGVAIVDRLVAYGATGVPSQAVARSLDDLDRAWSGAEYSDNDRLLLRRAVTMRIAPALTIDRAIVRRWSDQVGSVSALWDAVAAGESGAEPFQDAILSPHQPERNQPASSAFLHAIAAEQIGELERALALYARLDSIPFSVDFWAPGWGLRTQGWLRRARLFEALGRHGEAAAAYGRFLSVSHTTDPLVGETVSEIARTAPVRPTASPTRDASSPIPR
jgi:DNA-binding SARP family transcriptional activator/tetratricopeptide (TPR) repeat protein